LANQRATVPTYKINADEVSEAYEAYAALRRAAQAEPGLIMNKYFTVLQDTAYARFLLNFEVQS
jgi:hypothetical protein